MRASNGQSTIGHPQVLSRNVREFVHLISIGFTEWSYLHPQIQVEIWMGQRIIIVSLLQLDVICILKRKNKFIKFNEIMTLTKKIVENKHTTKCLALLSTKCSTRSPIGLHSRPRIINCKKKILSVKYIYKKQLLKNGCNKKNHIIRFACKTNGMKPLVCVVTEPWTCRYTRKKSTESPSKYYQLIDKWIVYIVTRIFQRTHSVDIPVCNEHCEHCHGK